MDILASLSSKAQQAELYSYEAESTLVSFEANEIKSAEVSQESGVALRGLVDGRMGFTAASGQISNEALIENLLASAAYGDEVNIQLPPAMPGLAVETFDPTLADVPLDRLVEIGGEIVERLRAVDPNAIVYVEIERQISRTRLRNSAGADLDQPGSQLSIDISVERVRGDDVLLVGDQVNEIALADSYLEATEHLARKIRLADKPARLRSGRMPVLFAPSAGLLLLLPIMLGVNGKNVQRGTSPLAEKLGETVFDPQLTIWDDPLLARRPASASHDDEGVPCYRKALIEQGRCAQFLFDLKTAALLGVKSSGNGARGLFSAPQPSPSNLVVAAGATPLSELVAGIEYGLLVDDVLGLGQGNAISGAFSNTLGLAFVIERGEIVGRVKDVSIAGNIYRDLRVLAGISQESRWVYGDILMPYILLPELNVVHQEDGD